MATKDTTEIKEKILSFLKTNGPGLPVQISREIKMDSIFASAFLSELLSQNKLKITSMKVGGSPLYYLEESIGKLEKPAEEYLKSKEKEAFLLLKEKKELVDSEQETAIRVALRSLKDFAIPKEKEGELIWKYFLIKEEEKVEEPKTSFPKSMVNEVREKFESSLEEENKKEENSEKEEKEKDESSSKEKDSIKEKNTNFSKDEQYNEKEKDFKKQEKKIVAKKKINGSGKKAQEKKNEMFFNTVKEFLKSKNMEISDIMGFTRGDLTLIVKDSGEEKLLVAYNKKKLTENDITNAHKKAKEKNLKYIVYTFGEPAKKTTNFIDAIRDLSSIEKLE